MTVADWLMFKGELVRAAALSRDALHIYFAVLAQIAACLLLRRKLGDWLPWVAVLILELANEGADLWVDIWPEHAFQAASAIHDIVNTMAVPTLLLVLSRWAPGMFARSVKPIGPHAAALPGLH